MPGFPVYVEDVQAKTEAANPPGISSLTKSPGVEDPWLCGCDSHALSPGDVLAFERKEFTVRNTSPTVPTPPEPWVVNFCSRGRHGV